MLKATAGTVALTHSTGLEDMKHRPVDGVMVEKVGLEPTAAGLQNQCTAIVLHPHASPMKESNPHHRITKPVLCR